jgi:hypothetical protein
VIGVADEDRSIKCTVGAGDYRFDERFSNSKP